MPRIDVSGAFKTLAMLSKHVGGFGTYVPEMRLFFRLRSAKGAVKTRG
jgi:hypothetical protein